MNNLVVNTKIMEVTNPVKLEGLKTNLDNSPLEVPIYQREYSWELEQVSDLFHDIDNSNDKSPLFLGSFLFFITEDNKTEVIDGQQRLTTIFLIIYCIRNRVKEWFKNLEDKDDDSTNRMMKAVNKAEDFIYKRSTRASDISKSNELYLTTGRRDRELFKLILQGNDFTKEKDLRRKSHKLLLNAYTFLDEKTKNLAAKENIKHLIEYLDKITDCLYISMTVNKKEDQRMLFKTLNSRGIELSESDLIKNEVCMKVKENDATREEIEKAVRLWDQMREIIEDVKANVDLFLFHYINNLEDAIEIRKTLEKHNSSDAMDESIFLPFIPEKMVFSAYEQKIDQVEDIIGFLEDLKEKADAYSEFYKPEVKSKPYTTYLEGLRAMNLTKCYPVLLRGKYKLSEKNFEKLAKAIESISLRHSILSKEPKDLEKLYYHDILKDSLKSDSDIDNIIKKIKEHSSMTDDQKFEIYFRSSAPKFSKMIIKRIINSMKDEQIDFSPSNVWFEHIMPQTPAGEWVTLQTINKDLYEEYLNRLGNLTYIKKEKNIGASNKDFNIKKEKYYSTSIITITKNISDYAKWDFDEIDNRQKYLYDIAKDIWKI